MITLLAIYLIGCVLSYGLINLNNEIPQYEGNFIHPYNSFKSWYFLFEFYYLHKY